MHGSVNTTDVITCHPCLLSEPANWVKENKKQKKLFPNFEHEQTERSNTQMNDELPFRPK